MFSSETILEGGFEWEKCFFIKSPILDLFSIVFKRHFMPLWVFQRAI